jgi:hypothetical protein
MRRATLTLLAFLAGLPLLAATARADSPPPQDTKYTIILLNFEGPAHVKQSKDAKAYFESNTPLRGFYLIHGEGQSTLYYGFYKAVQETEDPAEARRAKQDLASLSALTLNNERPFQGAFLIVLPTPNPDAPPALDICNSTGVYSLQVAAYKDIPGRKQAAVDAVLEARRQGYEAYYYHGPTTSSVLLGSFPASSVKITNIDELKKLYPERFAAQNELVLLPVKPADIPDEITQHDGRRVQVVAPQYQVLDPVLQDLINKFPHHALNGAEYVRDTVDPKTGKPIQVYAESVLVSIADIRRQSVLGGGRVELQQPPAPSPSPNTLAPKPTSPGTGKLKELK